MLSLLSGLKDLDKDRLDLEELVTFSNLARTLRIEYEALGVEVPEWLDNRTRELRREVKTRQADAIEKRIREAKSRLSALATPDEKRAALKAEIDRLEALVTP